MFDDDADADCVSVSDDQSVCGTIEREVDMTERSAAQGAEDARLRFNPPWGKTNEVQYVSNNQGYPTSDIQFGDIEHFASLLSDPK